MSVDSIHAALLAELPDSYQKTTGFPTWMLTRAMAHGLAEGEVAITKAQQNLDPENLHGDDLTHYVFTRTGQERREAVFASGMLTASGEGIIQAGDLFETEGGIQFRAAETVVVSDTANVPVFCVTPGAAGNVAAGTVCKMPVQLSGIDSITNSLPMTNGFDTETDAELLDRFLERLQQPVTGSNKWQYLMWAKEVSGVGAARVFPLGHGDGTVDVIIIDSDGQPASDTLVQTVQEYIDPESAGKGEGQAGIGAHCYVSAAEGIAINIAVTVKCLDSTGIPEAVQKSIAGYLAGIAFQQDYVSYGKLAVAINETAGVLDYRDFTMNGDTANISISERQVAVCGEVTVTCENT